MKLNASLTTLCSATLMMGLSHQAFAKYQSKEVVYVPGEMIVKLKEGSEKRFLAQKNGDYRVVRKINVSYAPMFIIKFEGDNKRLSSIKSSLESLPDVEYAEPNYIYTFENPRRVQTIRDILPPVIENGAYTPSDPKFGQLWGLLNTGDNDPGLLTPGIKGADVDATGAWGITKGSTNVRIAVIDTGIDYNHPDLKNQIWSNEVELNGKPGIDDDGNGYVDDIHGYDFANHDSDPMDGHGHGTHCAGTIGAIHNNNLGVAGVMSDVTLIPVKFLTDSGSGTSEGAIEAIDYATKLDVDLMSNSWGGGGPSEALKEAITRASEKGIVFTAAAGNSTSNNDNDPHYPSSYDVPNVIAVAAHNAQDGLASFSSYGKRSVHVAAPGENIISTVTGGKYDNYSGTSMATPHVSGVIGLYIAENGRTAHEDLRERVMGTAVPGRAYRKKVISGGRINAYNLLTNTRPTSEEPDPSLWQTIKLSEVFESAHPYPNLFDVSKTFTYAGARYLRVVLKKFDMEAGYDFVAVKNSAGAMIEKVSGEGANYITDYVEGDTLTVDFHSDRTVNKWGFLVEEVQVIY